MTPFTLHLISLAEDIAMEQDQRESIAVLLSRVVPVVETATRAHAKDEATRELEKINKALRDAGFLYPTGVRGVEDLIAQRDGLLEDR